MPFQQGSAATVHLLWPNKSWQLLGMYVSLILFFLGWFLARLSIAHY
jgi:hypothetical protein